MRESSLSQTTCAANRSEGIKSAGFLATISPRVASTSGSKTKVIASSSKAFSTSPVKVAILAIFAL